MNWIRARVTWLAVVVLWLIPAAGMAQVASKGAVAAQPGGLAPDDAQQQARFDAIVKVVAGKGYVQPVVVGMSKEPSGAVFVLRAVRGGKEVIVAVIEGGKSAPVVLQDEMLPDDRLGPVRFAPFLDAPDLMDVMVRHEPHQLESSYWFERHHVLRRKGDALMVAVSFNGDSLSAHAKGPRSVSSRRTVSVEKVAGAAPAFDLKVLDETAESSGDGSAASTTRTTQTSRYTQNAAGVFAPEKN